MTAAVVVVAVVKEKEEQVAVVAVVMERDSFEDLREAKLASSLAALVAKEENSERRAGRTRKGKGVGGPLSRTAYW